MSACKFANLQGRKDFGENIVRLFDFRFSKKKLFIFANTQEEMLKKKCTLGDIWQRRGW